LDTPTARRQDLVPVSSALGLINVVDGDKLLRAFLSGKSIKTIEAYKRDLEDFRLFLEAPDMDNVSRIFLSGGLHRANYLALKYKTHLSDNKKLQPTTVNRKCGYFPSRPLLGCDSLILVGYINREDWQGNHKDKGQCDNGGTGHSLDQGLLRRR
jgi:integrase/recombinase XerC